MDDTSTYLHYDYDTNNTSNITLPLGYGELFIYPIFEFEYSIMGILLPIAIILMSFMNLCVIVIFLSKGKRSPTNILFISIAMSDSMSAFIGLPVLVEIYSLNNRLISRSWCIAFFILRFYLFNVFHTVSVWQTLLLGIQRYLSVRYPFSYSRWCTNKRTLIVVLILYVLSFTLHVFHTVHPKFDVQTDRACAWVIEKPCLESCAYLWVTLLNVHLGPCLLLTVVSGLTLVEIRTSSFRLDNNCQPSRSVRYRAQRDRKVNTMVLLITAVFLIVELPYGVYYVMFMVNQHAHGIVAEHINNRLVAALYNVMLVLSFNCNFWIYFTMMKGFRRITVQWVTCHHARAACRRGFQRLRILSSRSSRSSQVQDIPSSPMVLELLDNDVFER